MHQSDFSLVYAAVTSNPNKDFFTHSFYIECEVAAALLSSFQDPGRRSSHYMAHTVLMAKGKRNSIAMALKLHAWVWHV